MLGCKASIRFSDSVADARLIDQMQRLLIWCYLSFLFLVDLGINGQDGSKNLLLVGGIVVYIRHVNGSVYYSDSIHINHVFC